MTLFYIWLYSIIAATISIIALIYFTIKLRQNKHGWITWTHRETPPELKSNDKIDLMWCNGVITFGDDIHWYWGHCKYDIKTKCDSSIHKYRIHKVGRNK